MPFLTDIDSRAAIKGSRDPLGLVPVWSRFGRFVVGNLTTVSNSVRGFTTLLLGYYLAEEIHGSGPVDLRRRLDVFLKFEQLAGYSRWHAHKDDDFRGRDRVVERLQKGPKATLGSDSANQILSNQKIYGLWGLFSVAARESGLLAPDASNPVLTPVAREFVERQYIARLEKEGSKGARSLVDMLRRERAELHLDGRDAALVQAIARILAPSLSRQEEDFYDEYLVRGGPDQRTQGRQRLLADLLHRLPPESEFDMAELGAIIKSAGRTSHGERLSKHLEEIRKVELLLVPVENAFLFLLTRDGQTLARAAGDIRSAWGRSLKHVDTKAIADVTGTIASAFREDATAARRFVDLAEALATGSYEAVLQLLLEHNAYVMEARNGSQPWARLEKGKIDVRYRDESGTLIPADELQHRWRNTYFINSLKHVVHTTRAA